MTARVTVHFPGAGEVAIDFLTPAFYIRLQNMNQDSRREQASQPLREKVKNLVRDQILAAAEESFAAQGLQSAKMEEIATRAGVAVGTVYNYFADRHALLSAVVQKRRADLSRELLDIEREIKGRPFAERLEGFLGGLLRHFESQRKFYSLLVQAECSPIKLVASSREGPFADVYHQAERLIRSGLAKGELRTESPEFLAQLLVGMARGSALRALADPKAPPIPHNLQRLLTFFLEGAASR